MLDVCHLNVNLLWRVQTNTSWRGPLISWFSTFLSKSTFRAVQFMIVPQSSALSDLTCNEAEGVHFKEQWFMG